MVGAPYCMYIPPRGISRLSARPEDSSSHRSGSMTHTFAFALLLAGLVVPVSGGEPQPEATAAPRPPVHLYSAGKSYLGVDIQDVTKDRVNPLKLKEERGVEITMVDADAPAGKAGLREHDVILQFNDTAVESEEQLRRLIRETPPGRAITLGISRDEIGRA